MIRPRIIALALVIASLACGVISGGKLYGPVSKTAHGDWSFVPEDSLCMLEIEPSNPRSITVGCYPHEGRLYIHSHRWASTPRLFGESWVSTVSRNPEVRVSLLGKIYELQAVLVAEHETRLRVL